MPSIAEILENLASEREALRASLLAFLAQDDNAALAEYACEPFAQRVAELCRPALFSPKGWVSDYEGWQLPGGEHVLIPLRVDDLLQTAQALRPQGELLLCDLSAHQGSSVALTLENNYRPRESVLVSDAGSVQSVRLLSEFNARLTLPSVEAVFPGYFKVPSHDSWYWHRIDLYESWAYSCFPFNTSLGMPYAQVGGYGQFVQSGEDTEFVAQINNEVGDCGSTYLLYRKPQGFLADIQMH